MTNGEQLYNLCETLFPIHRSITGNGLRTSLGIIRRELPGLALKEVPSGTKCFDWEIPQEWNIGGALIRPCESDTPICRFSDNNLHVVAYSEPIQRMMSLDELQPHLHSLPRKPDAIPYVTSYYGRNWGFCLSHNQRKALKDPYYWVYIDSYFKDGSMSYGEMIIPGRSDKEVLLSTYLCHPSMANDNLSGPVIGTFLMKWLSERDNHYTYRFLILPETIGAIYYLSRHLDELREKVIAGFVLTCMGDDRQWSYISSRDGNTLADRVAVHALSNARINKNNTQYYDFLRRGSDERQYCAPGVDLPVCSVMRTKYHEFPEYHTDKDDLTLISARGLGESLEMMKHIIESIEVNTPLQSTNLCEPMLSKHGLRSLIGGKAMGADDVMNVLAYADGRDALDIANIIGRPLWELMPIIDRLKADGLVETKV